MKSITYKKELETKLNKAYDKKTKLSSERVLLDIRCDENRHKKYNNDRTIRLLEEIKFVIENYRYLMKEALFSSGAKGMVIFIAAILLSSIGQSIIFGEMALASTALFCGGLSSIVAGIDYLKTTAHIRRIKKKNAHLDVDAEIISANILDTNLEQEYQKLLNDRGSLVCLIKDNDHEIADYEQLLNKIKKALAEELDPIVEESVSKEVLPPYLKRFTKELEV